MTTPTPPPPTPRARRPPRPDAARALAFLTLGLASSMSARASSPDPVPSWSHAPAEYGNFGSVVASAGDVNGDGVDDVIIGSPYWSSSSVPFLGRAYLFLGQCGEGLAPEPSWIAEGTVVGDDGTFMGSDVGSAGDVNADGFGDIFVLERLWLMPGSSACEPNAPTWCAMGRVHVWYGGPAGPTAGADGMASPADWTWAPGWWAEWIDNVDAGDVNGDGVSDLAVSVPDHAVAHIRIFPGAPGAGLPSQANQVLDDPFPPGQSGFGYVIGLGDIDADGFDDLLTGAASAINWSANADDAGAAHLFYGSAGGLQSVPGWTRWGTHAYQFYGAAVAIPGDMDGDGYADMAISAPASVDDWHPIPLVGPRVEMFRGGPDGPDAEPNSTIFEESWHLTSAGDVDGAAALSLPVYDDLAMERRPRGPDGRATGQEGFVVHGAASLVGEMTLVRDDVGGEAPIAGAGDVDADGADDVIVGDGNYFEPPSGEITGRAWLHPGRTSGFGFAPVEPPHCCEHPTAEELASLRVEGVTFTGVGFVAVDQDTGAPYALPHWRDGNLDGSDSTAGVDQRAPVAHVRGSRMEVDVLLRFDPAMGPAPTIESACLQIQGLGSDAARFFGLVNQQADGSLLASMASTGLMPDAIDFINEYQIEWQASKDGAAWTTLGTSRSRVYVLLEPPDPSLFPRFETVFDIACRAAVGCPDRDLMVERVYGEFRTPEDGVKRKAMDGLLVPDAVHMQYWATAGSALEAAIARDPRTLTLGGLLDPTASRGELNGKGRCGAWQDLFMACAQVHGVRRGVGEPPVHVGLHAVTVAPKYVETGLIVKNHTFSGIGASGSCLVPFTQPGLPPQSFPYIWPGLVQCSGSPQTSGISCDAAGVIGQRDPHGSPPVTNPTSFFENHALVLFNGRIYDPSYGSPVMPLPGPSSTPEAFLAALAGWEHERLDGYGTGSCQTPAVHTKPEDSSLLELDWGITP